MKKNTALAFAVLLTLGMACSCDLFQNNRSGTLKLKLDFDPGLSLDKNGKAKSISAGKAILPSEPWSPSRYVITGTGPGGASFSMESTRPNAETKIVPGEWSIEVHAFSETNKEVASQTAVSLLQPGKTTTTCMTLLPLEGIGSLSLSITHSFELSQGAHIIGSLEYRGLPGHDDLIAQPPIAIDIPAEQTSISFEGIPAGHYALVLKLMDADGSLVGGLADIIMLLAGYQTTGTCTILMGSPSLDLSASLFPLAPLPAPVLSVSHTTSRYHPYIPLAVPKDDTGLITDLKTRWFFNGEEICEGVGIIDNRGILPANTIAYPPIPIAFEASLLRADFVEESPAFQRAGSASVLVNIASGPEGDLVGWRASYDQASALGPALFETGSPYNNGTGNKSTVRAVAGSPSGLIVVSGLDKDGALHAFAAGYGAVIDYPENRDPYKIPVDASWIRLWRDEVKINGTIRNPDRLAVSPDGHFIAAASSSSNWLRVYALDDDGKLLRTLDVTQAVPGLENFSDIRGICFSNDGQKLYALANSPEALYSFSVSDRELRFGAAAGIDRIDPEQSLSLQDLKVTASGALIATSSATSRVFVFRDEGSLVPDAILTRAADGTGPYKPSSIAVSNVCDAFYVLCNSSSIVEYSRIAPTENYALAGSFQLPSAARGASGICAGKNEEEGLDILCASGGQSLGFFPMGSGGVPLQSHVLDPDINDTAGIGSANGICFVRGGYVLSGGTSGLVSVFGLE